MSLCVINDGLTNNGAVKLKATPCQRLLALAIISTALFTSQRMNARNTPYATQSPQATQQSATQSADQASGDQSSADQASGDQSSADQASDEKQASNEKKEQQTFTGVIEKSGDQLVLIDPLTKTSYQLDDQRKAQELVNKNVRVTGVLDPSTGTIRVSAIAPI
jgi:Protein of unknown function (DUF5818)